MTALSLNRLKWNDKIQKCGIEVTPFEIAEKLVLKLNERGLKIATAESCTGGMVAQYITAISGSSNVFEYGIIAYANRIKEEKLGVSAESLMRFGAVSREVALQMSKGAAISGKADIGISTTGIAGPTGGTPEKPVGTVYISVYYNNESYVKRLDLGALGDRQKIREAAAFEVLSLACQILNGEEQSEKYRE